MSAKSNHPADPPVKRSSAKVDHGLQCWLVVASCSLINLILFGIYRSYALLYTALLEDYHISRTQASWPFSLCMTIIHLTGPVSGLLNSKFSIRTIYATGCFLSTLGIGLCYFAVKVTDISIYIGVIQGRCRDSRQCPDYLFEVTFFSVKFIGFGIGLTYVQSVAILSEYFTEKLGMANGISMAGGTVGPFILSPLLEFFLENYKLKVSYIMLTAITMLTIPLCIVLKHNRKRTSSVSIRKVKFGSSKSYDLQPAAPKQNASQPAADVKLDVSLQRFQPLDELDARVLDTQQIRKQQTDNERQKAINLAFIEDQLTNSITNSMAANPKADQQQQLKIGEQAGKCNSHSLFMIDCNHQHQACNQEHHQNASPPIELRKSFFSLLKKQLSKFKSTTKRVSSIKKPALKLTNSISSNSMVSFNIQNLFTTMSSVYFLLICMSHLGRRLNGGHTRKFEERKRFSNGFGLIAINGLIRPLIFVLSFPLSITQLIFGRL